MYRYQLPVSSAATSASTPEAWAQEFAAATKSNMWKRLRLRLSREARLIARYIPRGQRVLDAGCGFGDWVIFLRRQGYDAQGCDYSPELVRRLRQTYPDVTWDQADIRSLPFADGSLDAIVSWGVIEHDEAGPAAALNEFRRVLRAGGVAVVTVPVDSPAAREAEQVFYRDDKGHGLAFFQYLMSEEELRAEAETAGYEVIESGSLPQAHINYVAPRLARRLRGFVHGAANVMSLLLLSGSRRYRVMQYAVLRKRS
jgi:SAM-dependent methyltransferase